MNKPTLIFSLTMVPLFLFLATGCSDKSQTSSESETTMTTSQMEDEAWHMEELYWEYVQNIDTVAYKTLWHEDFTGYPSFGDGVAGKSKIASWIPALHQDPNLKFSYTLHKKASNAIEDVVMVFYDTDYFWTDNENNIVRKERYKFTHTWKKIDGNWVILGGMAALKDVEVLADFAD